MTNRIEHSISKLHKELFHCVLSGVITAEALEKLRKELNLDLQGFWKFQEIKSLVTSTKLTLEEAQTVYHYLGETPEHFNKQPIEVKVVLMKLFAQLLDKVVQAQVAVNRDEIAFEREAMDQEENQNDSPM